MYILRFRHKVQQPTIQLLQLYKSSPIFIVKIARKAYSGKKVICEWQTSTLPNWQFELGVMHLWPLQKMTNFSIPLSPCTPHLQKWTIDLLFKNNGIRKHATMYGHLLDNLLILPGLNLCWTACFSLWILCTYLQAQFCIDLWKFMQAQFCIDSVTDGLVWWFMNHVCTLMLAISYSNFSF